MYKCNICETVLYSNCGPAQRDLLEDQNTDDLNASLSNPSDNLLVENSL